MMAEQDLDRNAAATPYKLQKAKTRGQVAKSTDFISTIVFITAVAYLLALGWDSLLSQFEFDQQILRQLAQSDVHPAALWPLLRKAIVLSGSLLAPFFLFIMLAAILGTLVQTGPVLAFEPLKADINRLNPVNGLKRVFSMRTLFETARACIKLVLLVWVSWHALRTLMPQFYNLASRTARGAAQTLVEDLGSLAIRIALAMAVIALIDLAYTRREFAKKMRMSQRELRDESKHREGDPRIRARQRELRKQALRRSLSIRQTRHADVILSNPTHLAVALRYVHGEMTSPQVIAKGAGQAAASMRKLAARHRIPVVQNPSLARRLYRQLQVTQYVPPDLYAEVARIIVWVFAMRKSRPATTVGSAIRGAQATPR